MLLCTRYADVLYFSQDFTIACLKVLVMAVSFAVLMLFERSKSSQEPQKDTCSLLMVLLPCGVLGFFTAVEWTSVEIFYSFSCVLEHFVLIPQYIYSYRDAQLRHSTLIFVVLRNLHRAYVIVEELRHPDRL